MSKEFEEPTPEDIEHEIEAINRRIDDNNIVPGHKSPDAADYCTLQYIPEERYRPWNWEFPDIN